MSENLKPSASTDWHVPLVSMRAYENSGDLTIEADALVFVDGKKTVRIPCSQITSVRWEPLDNDIANHWTVVRFTADDGKPDGVAFRDGGKMGHSQGTGMIYVTLRRAAKKVARARSALATVTGPR